MVLSLTKWTFCLGNPCTHLWGKKYVTSVEQNTFQILFLSFCFKQGKQQIMNIFETHLFSSHPLSAPNHLSDKRTHKVAVRPVPVQTLKKLKCRPKVPQVLRIFFRDFSSEAQPLFKPQRKSSFWENLRRTSVVL